MQVKVGADCNSILPTIEEVSTLHERRRTMHKNRKSLIALLGLLSLIVAIASISPRTGLGQDRPFICDVSPCDEVARGHAAFNDRNLTGLGANGRSCAD